MIKLTLHIQTTVTTYDIDSNLPFRPLSLMLVGVTLAQITATNQFDELAQS